jgi:diguanylate cyclase (GGDEF)-like protein
LRDQTDSLSALFFWSNLQKEQLVLECASLDDFAYQHLSPERRYPIEHDALSRVALQGNPQLFENIAPQAERDLIPYYNEPVGIRSFAAMPILFADAIVAVIAIDSTEEEAFSQETLRILSNYSKVITGLVRSYIEAYDLLTSARTLNAARKLFGLTGTNISKVTGIDAERTAEYIMRSLAEAAAELTEWKWLATVSFDDARRIWCISGLQAKSGEPYVLPKTRIDLTESLVGRSLRTGKSECVDRLNQQSIRFTVDEEKSGAIGHSFLVIPVRTSTKNYGALTLEHNESMKYTDVDIETLEHLARSAATALEIFALSEVVSERALTDILTGTYNKRGFKERFTEELARAKTYDEPLSLILFEIDDALKFSDRFGQEDIDTIVLALSKILQFIKHPFDVLARIGEFTFAVLLIKMSDEEAFLWSEKVRQKIVSEVIALSRKSFTITTSIGVAGARRNSNPDELLSAARMALDKAKERGGNEVIVY